MKKMKKWLKTVIIVLSVVVGVIAAFALFISIGMDLKTATIAPVDIAKVADGTYPGELNGSRFGNAVEVTVNGGKITDIKLVREMVIPQSGIADQVFQAVEQKQSLDVDTVSGGTISTKAYLKSIENALTSGK
jgi:uncharacterized protein with FMN-binding domain